MDSETLLEVIVNANPITHENPLPRALQYLMDETFAMHTFRPWSPQIIGDHFDLAVQLGDPAYVQQLLDIALNYVYANQSHRLAIRLRSRKLIGVTTKIVENNMIAFRITWNHHIPRASTMSSTRAVFRALETETKTINTTARSLRSIQRHASVPKTLPGCHVGEHVQARSNEHFQTIHLQGGGITVQRLHGRVRYHVVPRGWMSCGRRRSRENSHDLRPHSENPALTLIVVPVSLLAHWEQECKLRGLMTRVSHGRRVIKCPTFKAIKHFASSFPRTRRVHN